MYTYNSIFRLLYTLLSVSLFFSCQQEPVQTKTAKVEENTIETFVLKQDSLQSSISLPAELSGFREVELYAKVNSYVKNLWADIGDEVKQGQLLVDLEAPEIQSQLTAAKSKLVAQEAVAAASNSHYQRLLETSKVAGTISTNDLEQAIGKRNADKAQLEAIRAAYNETINMQDYLKIRAPFSGKVSLRNVNVGAYVGSNGSVPLLRVVDYRKLRLTVFVPESYAGLLQLGQQLNFKIASLRGDTFSGNIRRMSGALDKAMRTEQVELDIDNTNGKLLPGMVAEVQLDLKGQQKVFIVNKTAIGNTGEGAFVYRVQDNKVTRIQVDRGIETTDKVEIYASDLHENDVLLAKGNPELRTGDTVK